LLFKGQNCIDGIPDKSSSEINTLECSLAKQAHFQNKNLNQPNTEVLVSHRKQLVDRKRFLYADFI